MKSPDAPTQAEWREFKPRYAEAEGVLHGQFRHLDAGIYGNRAELINHEAYIVKYCDYQRLKSSSRHPLRLD